MCGGHSVEAHLLPLIWSTHFSRQSELPTAGSQLSFSLGFTHNGNGLVHLVPHCAHPWSSWWLMGLCVGQGVSWGQSFLCSAFLKRKSSSSMLYTVGLPCLYPQVRMLPINTYIFGGHTDIRHVWNLEMSIDCLLPLLLFKNNLELGRCLSKMLAEQMQGSEFRSPISMYEPCCSNSHL